MKPIVPGVFRAYDIRGLVDHDFDPEWVRALGRACAGHFLAAGHDRAVIGRDCRHSSAEYQRQLGLGLAEGGVDVIRLPMVSTPLFYYAVKRLSCKAGVMVTASHNPPEYNGFKVWCGETTIHSDEIRALYEIMAAQPETAPDIRPGLISEHDPLPGYLDELAAQVRLQRPVKVVVDGGNGASGEITAELLERVGCEVVRLYCEPDGDFPNHHPDPVVEAYTADLQKAVVEHGAMAGIGLDGDGDRIGAVDETGRLLFGDELTAIYARPILAENPGAVVIGDVKCSHRLFADIEAHGGEPVMSITGHSIVKARMLQTGALLGGEMSGHIFFAHRYFGFDDATYAALRLVEILGRADCPPLSALLADWPTTYNTPEIRMDCPETIKFAVVARAQEHFSARYETITMDGARVQFGDGWGLVRASNTQPALVLRFEAETPERLAEIRGIMEMPIQEWIAQGG